MLNLKSLSASILIGCPALAYAGEADLQKQIDELRQQLDATAEMVESSSNKSTSKNTTTIGGYGELHYNNWTGENGAKSKKELDFHRFVLFFGHEFSNSIRFFSEVELEHAISGGDYAGEIELEQAYVEFDLSQNHRTKAGLFLIPVGILNETHEPPTFYGVERNPVEKNIVPTTWWEGGVALSGEFAKGWHYDTTLTSGLDIQDGDIRGGRQKVSKANAEHLMGVGRIKWTGIAGLEIAATATYQDGYEQVSTGPNKTAQLFETHVAWEIGHFGLRALYATWNLEDAADGRDKQTGYYIEPAWRFNEKVGVFVRYNNWDNQAGDSSIDSEKIQYDAGVNYWPHPDVVLKADYQKQEMPGDNNQNGFNLGVGYQF